MKKIIAFMAALFFAAVVFDINTKADSINGGGGSFGEYDYSDTLQEYLYVVNDWRNGDITYEQYVDYTALLAEECAEVLSDSVGLELISQINGKIAYAVTEFGGKAPYYVSGWIDDILNDYTKSETVSTTDRKGYGAMLYFVGDSMNNPYAVYCEYIVVSETGSPPSVYAEPFGEELIDYYNKDGSFSRTEQITWSPGLLLSKCRVYGDVRYSDGSQAPTDDEYINQDTHDFTGLNDSELEELLNKLLEELNRNNPDLSTIEGLLSAIYYQTTGINDKMITYDECNALIMSLLQSNNQNAESIVNALMQLRDDLLNNDNSGDGNTGTEGGGESSGTSDGHPNHICGTVYNVKPLDMNWIEKLVTDPTEVKVQYQNKAYFLESCGCLLIDDKYYSIDMNYDDYMSVDFDFSNDNVIIDNKYVDVDFNNFAVVWNNLSIGQKNKINSVVTLIYKMLEQAVPYAAVTSAFPVYEVIIFNTTTPEDVVLTFESVNAFGQEIEGFEVTLLSTSFFANEDVAAAMKLVRSLLTVIIGYWWLLSMRKKVVGMMG